MVPRGGLPQSNEISTLESGGTPKHPTRSLGFPPRVSHQNAACECRAADSASTLTIIVTPAPSSNGRYQSRLDGDYRVLCVSRTPFFDAARKLVAEGHDYNTTLLLRHAGSDTDSLRVKLGTAASLTVEETGYGPQLRRWKPISTLAVAPRIAPKERAATTLVPPRSEARYRQGRT
jgi:hypothetical protein